MPYRNALRDNWQRYQDANDAEMRMYARERMQNVSPQGAYAGVSMDDMFRMLQGGDPEDLRRQQEQPVYVPQEQLPVETGVYSGYNTPSSEADIARRRAMVAEAAGRGY